MGLEERRTKGRGAGAGPASSSPCRDGPRPPGSSRTTAAPVPSSAGSWGTGSRHVGVRLQADGSTGGFRAGRFPGTVRETLVTDVGFIAVARTAWALPVVVMTRGSPCHTYGRGAVLNAEEKTLNGVDCRRT